MYLAIKHFRHFIEGREFHILTGHQLLTFSLHAHHNHHSPRQARHLDFVAQFTTDIHHISGADNAPADALSRMVNTSVTPENLKAINFEDMVQHQAADCELQESSENPDRTTLKLEKVSLTFSGTTLLCDVSTGSYRPIVPSSMHRLVFDKLHSMSHPGINATQRLLTSQFVWPHVKRDVERWSKECLDCQHNKVTRHT